MKEWAHCFRASQHGGFMAGSQRESCPSPRLSWTQAPVMPPRKGMDVPRIAVHGLKPKPSTEATPNRQEKLQTWSRAGAWADSCSDVSRVLSAAAGVETKGRGEESWIWGCFATKEKIGWRDTRRGWTCERLFWSKCRLLPRNRTGRNQLYLGKEDLG